MRIEEAKVNMRIRVTRTGEKGVIIRINKRFPICEVKFDNGMCEQMTYTHIEKVEGNK